MRGFIFASFVLIAAVAQQSEQYDAYLKKFGHTYLSQHYTIEAFTKNLELINQHNKDPLKTYKLSVNQFSGVDFSQHFMHDKRSSY